MNHAIQITALGGPEQLHWTQLEIPAPGTGEVRMRQTAIGLNFIDVYFRTGLYPAPGLPFIPGFEAAGVVEALGPRVREFQVGDRVAYASGPLGAYAEVRNYPAERLIPLPEDISERTAAAALLKGMTAEYLLRRTYRVRQGETILVHAAAGGVGQLLCQWAAGVGVSVIGTVGSDEKAQIARGKGCSHTIVYSREDITERVKEITGGSGVPVVYDGVGQATFQASLTCLQPRGTLVSFGQASGKVPPLDIGELSRRGSLYLTRPTLFDYVREREDLLDSAAALFEQLRDGHIKLEIGSSYPLRDAARAHQDLEARRTLGSSLLLP